MGFKGLAELLFTYPYSPILKQKVYMTKPSEAVEVYKLFDYTEEIEFDDIIELEVVLKTSLAERNPPK